MIEGVLGRLTPEQAFAGKRYLAEVAAEREGDPTTLAIVTPWPPPQPLLKNGLLLSALLALDDALGDATVSRLDLRLDDIAGNALEEVFATRWFGQVREVRLGKASAKALAALASGGTSVTFLDVAHIKVGKGVAKLSGLLNLETLHLGHAGMDAAATKALGGVKLPALRRLDLDGWGGHVTAGKYNRQVVDGQFKYPVVDEAHAKALLDSELGARLTHLTLKSATLNGAACAAFGEADLGALEALHISELNLEDANALLRNPLRALRHLERAEGFAGSTLAKAAFVPQLQSLSLGGSAMKERDVCALLGRATSLTSLTLKGMGLGHDTAQTLVDAAAPLTELRLTWNALGDQSAKLLSTAPFASELTVFSVSNNALGGPGVAALAQANFAKLERVGLGGLSLTSEEAAPLWNAPWLAGCTGVTLSGNQLDDDVVPRLTLLRPETWVYVNSNRFSPAGMAALRAHFGTRVVGDRQNHGRPATKRALFDEVFGLKFRASPRKPFERRDRPLPAWVADTGLRVVGQSARANVAVQADPEGGEERLVVLLDWEQQTAPLGVPASALGAEGRVHTNTCIGDGPLLVGVPGDGVYAVDIYRGGVQRLGDVGASVYAIADMTSADGASTTGTAVLHGTEDNQTLDFYVPQHEDPKRQGVTGLAGFQTCGSGTYGEVLIVGPGYDVEGAVRFFAVSADDGLAPMGGFDTGFAQVPGGVAQGDQTFTPESVSAAARRAFQRRDAEASS